jgi:hypothetical protein
MKSRRIRLMGQVVSMEEKRGAFWVLVGKPKGKRPLEIRRHRWEDNFKMNLKGVE